MTDGSNIKIARQEILHNGFNRITRYIFEHLSFDGKTLIRSEKEVLERKDAAAILLFDPKLDSVVMIEQFRPGCFIAEQIAYPLEIPAGLVDEGDASPQISAEREAWEEAGCRIDKVINIGHFYPEISFGTRKIHLFCARTDASQCAQNGGEKHEGEDTKIRLIPLSELRNIMEDKGLINSHTLIAVQWFFLNLERIRAKFAN